MKSRDIEENIKCAVTQLVPDVLDDILAACGNPNQPDNICVILPKRRNMHWIRIAGAAAACMLLISGILTLTKTKETAAETLIMLDVNPSIEISISQANRVTNVTARNKDAIQILDNMNLIDVPIDVTINALIGSMLKYGYIRENSNSVLLSVEGEDSEKNAALQKSLTDSISQQLNMVNGAVISQSLTDDDSIRNLAEEYGISNGKAALIQKIIAQNTHLLFADLAELSVNNLNLLYSSKGISSDEIDSQGNASDTDYIGEAKAEQTALNHAGISGADALNLHTELDYDDGMMVYDIEFLYRDREYEYEINAGNGAILEYSDEDSDD